VPPWRGRLIAERWLSGTRSARPGGSGHPVLLRSVSLARDFLRAAPRAVAADPRRNLGALGQRHADSSIA
jgi:hypothetical protein